MTQETLQKCSRLRATCPGSFVVIVFEIGRVQVKFDVPDGTWTSNAFLGNSLVLVRNDLWWGRLIEVELDVPCWTGFPYSGRRVLQPEEVRGF